MVGEGVWSFVVVVAVGVKGMLRGLGVGVSSRSLSDEEAEPGCMIYGDLVNLATPSTGALGQHAKNLQVFVVIPR